MEWVDLFLVKFFVPIAWPLVVFVIFLVFRKNIFDWLSEMTISTPLGVKLVLSGLKKTSLEERKKIGPNEIWALDTFSQHPESRDVKKMKPAQKVMAVSLKDAGLIVIKNNQLEITESGQEVLKNAENIL